MGEILGFLIGGIVSYCYHKFSVEKIRKEMISKIHERVEEERKSLLNSLPYTDTFKVECDICKGEFFVPLDSPPAKRISVVFEVEEINGYRFGKGYKIICEDCEKKLIEQGKLFPHKNESVDIKTYLQQPLSGKPSGVVLFLSDFTLFAPPKDKKEAENLIKVAKKLYNNFLCFSKKEDL